MKTALYARYSTEKQDARSIDDQLRRCRALAATKGWTVVVEHHDAALSGSSRARPLPPSTSSSWTCRCPRWTATRPPRGSAPTPGSD